ncbi:MAG: hypothetical protein AB1332_10090, partial [Pseudomonadota bacterium]
MKHCITQVKKIDPYYPPRGAPCKAPKSLPHALFRPSGRACTLDPNPIVTDTMQTHLAVNLLAKDAIGLVERITR